jgi:GT2 family glycosyltransferase
MAIPKVSIVYPNWNTTKELNVSIKAIEKFPPKVLYEIIIVDNGSTDGFVEWSKAHPQYRYIFNEENLGFAIACNQGVMISKGKYVCLINTDTEPSKGWLDELVKYLDADPFCGIAAPSAINVCQPKQAPDFSKDKIIDVTMVPFMCVVIPKKVFYDTGFLLPKYGEDNEYCQRVINSGRKIVIVGTAYVHHFLSRSYINNGVGMNSMVAQNFSFKTNECRFLGEEVDYDLWKEWVNAYKGV